MTMPDDEIKVDDHLNGPDISPKLVINAFRKIGANYQYNDSVFNSFRLGVNYFPFTAGAALADTGLLNKKLKSLKKQVRQYRKSLSCIIAAFSHGITVIR